MPVNYRYLKNSNTGELLMEQKFTHHIITNIPTHYYKKENNKTIEIFNVDLTGFVEIKEKTYLREIKKK